MRAIVYCRVSSASQEEGSSLSSQAERCAEHAVALGYEVTRTVKEVFSGAYLFDRPELNRVRDDVRRGSVDAVVVYAVDRLSRNVAHLHIISEEFEQYGVALIFVTEEFDKTPEGKLLQSVKGYVGEVEREKIRERTMRGRRTKVLNGTISHKRPLFGYTLTDDGNRTPNPETAPVVKQMFQDITDGSSLRQIAERMDSNGISTPTGKGTWFAHSVAVILKNPAYSGKLTMYRYKHEISIKNGRRSETSKLAPRAEWVEIANGNTPAIITETEFADAQAAMERNRLTRRRPVKVEGYLLRGLVFCGNCSRQMAPRTSNKGYRTYVCTSKQSTVTNCGMKMLRATEAEDTVWQTVATLISDPDELRALVASAAENVPDVEDELNAVRQSISKCQAEIGRMEKNLLQADARSFDSLNRVLSKKHDELERLNGVRSQLAKDQRARDASSNGIDSLIETAMQNLEDDRAGVLRAFGVRITWDGEKLKASISAPFYCQTDLDSVDNRTIKIL